MEVKTGIEKIVAGVIQTNCYIVKAPEGGAAVIDAGGDAEEIIAKLEKLSLVPRYFLFTHGHLDHIAALPELSRYYRGKGVKFDIAIHKDDAYFLGAASREAHLETFESISEGSGAFVDSLWEEMPRATILLKEGDKIAQFKVLHLPGHSRGSAGFYDEAGKVLFGGDTLFRGGVGRTDLPESSIDDLYKSLKRLKTLSADVLVCPGHGPETTIREEAGHYF